MKNEGSKKLEIFLLLALRQAARSDSAGSESDETAEGEPSENAFSAIAAQLSAADAEKFERLRTEYRNKSGEEKEKWRARIETFIGTDEPSVDDSVHRSHVGAALEKEIPAIRKIVVSSLSPAHLSQFSQKRAESESSKTYRAAWLEKNVRRAFAKKFVALRDLPAATAFDRLSGAQFARLIRHAGIREVALACVRIEAVESVTAFLRRFAAEDARAIAAQLSASRQISDERLSFAENRVQSALEIEPQPSAMLDLLGIRLVGNLLCANAARAVYTEQKLPLEVAPKLSEIIETQCRQTPPALQLEIGAEVERLAETIMKTTAKAKADV